MISSFDGSSDAVQTSSPDEPQEVGRERADRSCAEHERALGLPRLATADCPYVSQSPLADGHGLGQDAQPPQRLRDGDELRRILDDELAREPVQPGDPAFDVVAGEAGVGEALGARETVPAGAAHGRGDQVAPREPMTVPLDPPERLVAEHQLASPFGRHAEHAV